MSRPSLDGPILIPTPSYPLPFLEFSSALADPPVSAVVSTGRCWKKILPQRCPSFSTFGPSWLKVRPILQMLPWFLYLILCLGHPYCRYSTHVIIFSFWNLHSSLLQACPHNRLGVFSLLQAGSGGPQSFSWLKTLALAFIRLPKWVDWHDMFHSSCQEAVGP